jgi:hypothetical protein
MDRVRGLKLRVEYIAQTFAQEVEGQHGEQHRQHEQARNQIWQGEQRRYANIRRRTI